MAPRLIFKVLVIVSFILTTLGLYMVFNDYPYAFIIRSSGLVILAGISLFALFEIITSGNIDKGTKFLWLLFFVVMCWLAATIYFFIKREKIVLEK